ncbi:putative bifunctional diguanylate cyclase/phosphodiesterase [Roseicyclus marinus]|uniref:putative bifunctional diguanylate cyclase/phosphodiesterase n=1 Tax=Roseicyclus marinus TaxID=2161673 RepID=UPI00240FE3BB|nr:EAL domain-containing protein [Roseicyclus marinus]MDG3039801.1 EAL domain-containing protein [Roseicyclus marinus]
MELQYSFGLLQSIGILSLCTLLVTVVINKGLEGGIRHLASAAQGHRLLDRLLLGLVFGLTSAVLIATAYHADSGSILDARAAPALLSGIVGGPVAAILTALIGGIARYLAGGPFVIGGTLSLGVYALTGILLGKALRISLYSASPYLIPKIALASLISSICVIPSFFMDQPMFASWEVIKLVFPSILLQNVLGAVLLGSALILVLRYNQSRKILLSAIESLPEAFAIYDQEDRLLVWNSRYKEVYARSADMIQKGMKFEDIIKFGLKSGQYLDAVGREEEWLEERLRMHRNPTGPIEQRLADDEFVQVHEVRTTDGETVGFRTNITLLKRQQRQLEEQAADLKEKTQQLITAKELSDLMSRTDELTGLGNRRGLDAAIEEFFNRIDAGMEIWALLIDLDHFTTVNDLFGHKGGDRLLVHVAKLLSEIAPDGAYVSRIGSDEFVMVLSAQPGDGTAEATARAIISACEKPLLYEEQEIHFGASLGLSMSDDRGCVSLIENADIALRKAKQSGRGQYHLFTPEMRALAETRKWMADELVDAIASSQIRPHFQPQVSALDHAFVGVEVLARWHHPTEGWIPPNTFIPLAQEFGLLTDVEELVARESILMVQRLKADGLHVPKLSLNARLSEPEVVRVLEVVDKFRPWSCDIAVELLETVDYSQNYAQLEPIVEKIRASGITIELDDFGSGNASLTTLLKMRPDRIKLDRRLVASLASSGVTTNPLVETIAEMCQRLNIPMTAEGVEVQAQAEILASLGCDALQGFLFAPALSEEELKEWISQHRLKVASALL